LISKHEESTKTVLSKMTDLDTGHDM